MLTPPRQCGVTEQAEPGGSWAPSVGTLLAILPGLCTALSSSKW